jgi:hypothetical protein
VLIGERSVSRTANQTTEREKIALSGAVNAAKYRSTYGSCSERAMWTRQPERRGEASELAEWELGVGRGRARGDLDRTMEGVRASDMSYEPQ